jgi:hypothetical protein
LVALYTGALASALGGAFIVAAIVGSWTQLKPRPKDATTWLLEQGIDSALRNALTPVLTQLWSAAWSIGAESAAAAAGATAPQFNARDFMERWGHQWVNQVVHTRLQALAKILAEGPDDTTGLAAAVSACLSNQGAAELVALTEVTRAVNIAASEAYRQAGIWDVIWHAYPTACPTCAANAEAGPRPLGVPFPSGATAPPQHPRCRCALLPA